jgi:hypothetical protein
MTKLLLVNVETVFASQPAAAAAWKRMALNFSILQQRL